MQPNTKKYFPFPKIFSEWKYIFYTWKYFHSENIFHPTKRSLSEKVNVQFDFALKKLFYPIYTWSKTYIHFT